MVDHLIPIARAYRTRVRLFQAQLHRDESKFKKEQMRLVLGMKSELQRLQRRIRPMTAVVRHLMDDENVRAWVCVCVCVWWGGTCDRPTSGPLSNLKQTYTHSC